MTSVDSLKPEIPPVRFETPGIGVVEIDAATDAFLDWVENNRCDVPDALFRRLLIDQATGADPTRTPSSWEDLVNGLSDEQVEAGAAALVAASGDLFRPVLISEGKGLRRRARSRRQDEAYAMDCYDGESRSAHLLRLLDAALLDRLDRRLLLIQSPERSSSPGTDYLAALGQASAAQKAIKQIPGIGAAIKAAQVSTIVQHMPALRLSQIALDAPGLKAARGIASRNDQILGGIAAYQARPLLRSADMVSALPGYEKRLRTIGLLAQQTSSLRVAGLVQGGVYGQLIDAAMKISLARSMPRLSPILVQTDWLKDINRSLHLGMSSGLIAAAVAAAGITASAAPSQDFDMAASFMQPGWQAAAAVAMANDTVRGAGAALLNAYDASPGDDAPLFDAALASLHEINEADDALLERLLAQFEPAWAALHGAGSTFVDSVRSTGRLAILEFMLLLISVVLSQQSLAIAAQGPTKADIERFTAEKIAVIREEGEKTRAAATDEARSLRSVDKSTMLRTAPHQDAHLLQWVFPDELIRVLDEKDAWLKIEVYGYGNDSTTTGWVERARVGHRP